MRVIQSDAELSDLFSVSDVLMIGYPIGLWDEKNNLPLIRRGITAVHPKTNFNGNSVGCIDIAALPGSSGSPVVIFDQGVYATRGSTVAGSRAILLGVLFAGPRQRIDGKVEIVEIPTASVAVSAMQIPAHLGYYVKAKEILELKSTLFKTHGLT